MTDTTSQLAQAKGQASESASAVAGTVKEQASSVAETATAQAREVAGEARNQLHEVVTRSRSQLQSTASEQSERVAQTLQDIGQQLRGMQRGEGAPSGVVADVTEQIASTVERTAQRLQDGGLEGALDDARRLARQRPGLFLLGALGAGIAVGRLVRATDTKAIAEAAKPGGSDSSDGHGGEIDQGHATGAMPPVPSPVGLPTPDAGDVTGVMVPPAPIDLGTQSL